MARATNVNNTGGVVGILERDADPLVVLDIAIASKLFMPTQSKSLTASYDRGDGNGPACRGRLSLAHGGVLSAVLCPVRRHDCVTLWTQDAPVVFVNFSASPLEFVAHPDISALWTVEFHPVVEE